MDYSIIDKEILVNKSLWMLWKEPDFNLRDFLTWHKCIKYQDKCRVYMDECNKSG